MNNPIRPLPGHLELNDIRVLGPNNEPIMMTVHKYDENQRFSIVEYQKVNSEITLPVHDVVSRSQSMSNNQFDALHSVSSINNFVRTENVSYSSPVGHFWPTTFEIQREQEWKTRRNVLLDTMVQNMNRTLFFAKDDNERRLVSTVFSEFNEMIKKYR